jgi:hypothetical protein
MKCGSGAIWKLEPPQNAAQSMHLISSADQARQDGAMNIWRSEAALLAGFVIVFNLLALVFVQRNNANFEKGDFKMFYAAAVGLRSGHSGEIYDPNFHVQLQRQLVPSLPFRDVKVYTHPPYELLVYLPLSYLPYKAACYCWIAITLLLAVLCGRMLPGYAAILGLFPLLVAVLEQQDSVLALLIVICSWLALRRGRDGWAGFVLGLALFRFQFILPFALILMFWKPKLLKGFVPSGILVVAVSLAMVGPAGLRSYADYMSSMANASSKAITQRGYIVDPRTNPTLRGLIYEVTGGGGGSASPATSRILPAAIGILELLCLAAAWMFMRSDAPTEGKFAFAILAGLVLSFYLLMHDLVLLALPFTLLRGRTARCVLIPFYIAPLIYCFYPHSQAWLALLLLSGCGLIAFDKSSPGSTPSGGLHFRFPRWHKTDASTSREEPSQLG